MTRDDLVELSKHRNVAAFLRVIRQAESNQTEHAYRIRWGGSMITGDLAAHPGDTTEATDRNGRVIRSSASGAYQFLASTWRDVAGAYGITDFSPPSQDAAAVALIRRASALDDILAGRFEAAVRKCAPVWAGLPGDVYGQGGISMADARRVYEQYGGQYAPAEPRAPAVAPTVETAPAPPIAPAYDEFGSPESPPRASREAAGVQPSPRPADASGGLLERPAMPAPIAAAIATVVVPELLKLLPWWQKAESKGVNTQAIQAAIVEAAKAAAAKPTLEEAATVVTTDPAAQARFVQQAAVRWADIAPALQFDEQSREKAREFGDRVTSTGPEWRQMGAGAVIGVLALVVVLGGGTMFYQFMHSPEVSAEQKGMILGALIAAFGSVLSYFFGSSASSRAKDQALTERR